MARKILKDDGHEETEKLLAKLEQQIAKEYKQAEKEVQDKLNDYLRRFQIKDQLKQRALAAGEITQAEYDKWRVGQIMIGQRWEEMKATLAQDFSNANQLARSTAFDHMPEVYAINHNYGTFQVEKGALVDTSYTLYDRQTVEKLLMDDAGHFIPAPGKKVSRNIAMGKDVAWNKKNVQSCMLQGILQGESIPKMATRLAKSVGEQNRKAAIRNVRTMATGVQNAGRIASYERAESMGIKLKKQWLATLDDRTRHWHRDLDGQTVPTDEPFKNEYGEIMYPGDPDADPANIYNCRCTLIAALEGFERDLSDLSLRNDNHLGDMTYEEWKEEHESTSEPITRQDEISETMQRVYGGEYRGYEEIAIPTGGRGETSRDFVTESVGAEKGDEQSIVRAVKKSNPNGYTKNCQRCVQAYELRRRGYEVSALDIIEKEKVRWGSECFLGNNYSPENAYNAFTFNITRAKMEDEILSTPVGSRHAVYLDWGNGIAHTLVAERTEKGITYVDPQMKEVNALESIEVAVDGRFGIFRMDDKPITLDKEIIRLTVEGYFDD